MSLSPSRSLPEEESFLNSFEDHVPPTPLPTSTIIELPFSNLLHPPLRIQTDTFQCGGQLWPAGMVLSEYLIRHHLDEMRGKTILELGTGSGLVGLAIGLALKQRQVLPSSSATASPATTTTTALHLTDGTLSLIPLIEANAVLNDLSISSQSSATTKNAIIHPSLLQWGTSLTTPPADIILAADCVYFEPSFPVLEKTIDDAMGAETVLWFCYMRRRRRDSEMLRRLRKNAELVVREVDTGELGRRYGRGTGYGTGVGEGRGKGGGVVLFEIKRTARKEI